MLREYRCADKAWSSFIRQDSCYNTPPHIHVGRRTRVGDGTAWVKWKRTTTMVCVVNWKGKSSHYYFKTNHWTRYLTVYQHKYFRIVGSRIHWRSVLKTSFAIVQRFRAPQPSSSLAAIVHSRIGHGPTDRKRNVLFNWISGLYWSQCAYLLWYPIGSISKRLQTIA